MLAHQLDITEVILLKGTSEQKLNKFGPYFLRAR